MDENSYFMQIPTPVIRMKKVKTHTAYRYPAHSTISEYRRGSQTVRSGSKGRRECW